MEIVVGIVFIGLVAFFGYRTFKKVSKGDECREKNKIINSAKKYYSKLN